MYKLDMRSFKAKDPSTQEVIEMSYYQIIEASLAEAPTDSRGNSMGISTPELFKRTRVLRIVESFNKKNAKVIELEDADFEVLKKVIQDKRWPSLNQDSYREIEKFILYITDELKPEPIDEPETKD